MQFMSWTAEAYILILETSTIVYQVKKITAEVA